MKGKILDGSFRIEYDSDLLCRGLTVVPENGSTITIKKHRIMPLIMIVGRSEDFIESREVKTFFKLFYEWEADSSDFERDEVML